MMLIASAIVIAMVIPGPPRIVTQPSSSADDTVELRAGETIRIDGRARIGFERVESDSRCPIGLRCISAGEAIVRIWLEADGRTRESASVRGPSRTNVVMVAGYRIRLVSLTPYPEASQTRRASDYTVTLAITGSP